jgi:hypothetical protein
MKKKKIDMRIYKTIFTSERVIIQRITTILGDCKMIKFREIIKDVQGKTLEVNDLLEPPIWYLRSRKLGQLGI